MNQTTTINLRSTINNSSNLTEYMQEEHFGKLLAKISGVDLDELNASVESSKKKQISERMQFSLDDDLLYIKNQYEYFEDTPTHYINQNPVKHGEYNEKIASYLTLKMLEKQPDLLLAIGELEDYFEYDKEIEQFLF